LKPKDPISLLWGWVLAAIDVFLEPDASAIFAEELKGTMMQWSFILDCGSSIRHKLTTASHYIFFPHPLSTLKL
jgi:hypothetical protein